MPSLVEIWILVLDKISFLFSTMYFCYFVIIYPWKRSCPIISPKDALCQIWLIVKQWVWRRRFFLISSMYFRCFVIISPWKRAWPFIWTNLKFHNPRMLCVKFGWTWPVGSGDEDENVKILWQRTDCDQTSSRPSAQVS